MDIRRSNLKSLGRQGGSGRTVPGKRGGSDHGRQHVQSGRLPPGSGRGGQRPSAPRYPSHFDAVVVDERLVVGLESGAGVAHVQPPAAASRRHNWFLSRANNNNF